MSMVISDGDPLEIYTEADGEVIFKNIPPWGSGGICRRHLRVPEQNTASIAAVADRDSISPWPAGPAGAAGQAPQR
jgi:hypothetical protein